MMRILYAETTAYGPSGAHFLEALEAMASRRECEFHFLDEAQYLAPADSLGERVARRVLGRPARGYRALNLALVSAAACLRPEIILIGKGAQFTPGALAAARRESGAALVNWATDDPFNSACNSRNLVRAIPLYDLYVCTRRAVMDQVASAGCRNVAYVRFGYKPALHYPEPPASAQEHRRFDCDVSFIGGADGDRAPYFEALVRALPEVKLHLYGGYWRRFETLASRARGFVEGREFRLAVGGSKIAVNLVRRRNRDDHVMRTFELAACGGFMLAERTATHQELFVENREAAFFDSPASMVDAVRAWLARDAARARIAAAGRCKVTGGRHTYADRLREILALARPLHGCRPESAAAVSFHHAAV
jgi:spore maturation protein CgeB